jgi:uncharacterized Ntn-hydrolase superfamily protein
VKQLFLLFSIVTALAIARHGRVPSPCATGCSALDVLIPEALRSLGPASSENRVEGVPLVATFSIVAADPRTGELGIAVQSRFLAVGAVVPWAKAGIGAIATQSRANTTYGPEGLKLLAGGMAPEDTVKRLTAADPEQEIRQVGIVAADGRAATFTGASCLEWAGGRTGPNYAVQGNILAGEAVVTAMAESFEKSATDAKDLGQRLLDALAAGQSAGGDKRGMQSAALLIVREGWGYAGLNDRYRDLRVDDHTDPIAELQRIYELHRRLFPQPGP